MFLNNDQVKISLDFNSTHEDGWRVKIDSYYDSKVMAFLTPDQAVELATVLLTLAQDARNRQKREPRQERR
jgi:hypothetical protein